MTKVVKRDVTVIMHRVDYDMKDLNTYSMYHIYLVNKRNPLKSNG